MTPTKNQAHKMPAQAKGLMPDKKTSVSCLIDKLPGDLKRIAELTGIEASIKIAREFKGTCLYISSIDNFMREIRDLRIRQDFDRGIAIKRLAIKYSLTERWIRNILNKIETITEGIAQLIDKI